MQTRTRIVHAPALDLPPLFKAVTLREVGDAFAHAQEIAPQEGAGTLVHVGRFDLVEFAVVLEPEEPLQAARRAFYAGMVALRDALVTHAPPERPITIAWPDAIHVDGGLIGGGRFAWPAGMSELEPPDWVVFGATIRTVAMTDQEAGLSPLAATLEEEGFEDLGRGRLAESFARHLMVAIDAWQNDDFSTVAHKYLEHVTIEKGAAPQLADNGDLLVRWPGQSQPDRHSLAEALAAPSWLDPATGGPRS